MLIFKALILLKEGEKMERYVQTEAIEQIEQPFFSITNNLSNIFSPNGNLQISEKVQSNWADLKRGGLSLQVGLDHYH